MSPIFCDHCGHEVNKHLRPALTQEQGIRRQGLNTRAYTKQH